MEVDRVFERLLDLEQRLEEIRDEARRTDPPPIDASDSSITGRADRRQLARNLRGLEKHVSSAARSARDARRLLTPYAEPPVREDEDVDPSEEVDR